jgi:drug/metabolite transporter (DMT)-like permease
VLLRPKVLATGLDPVVLVLVEHLLLTLLFGFVVVRSRRDLMRMSLKEFLAVLFISWFGSVLATVLLTQAYVAGDPLTATLLQKLQPLFAILLAGPILHESRVKGFWIGVLGALAGAYLMSFGLTWIGDPFHHKGMTAAGYAAAAAALWGTCTVVGRWVLGHLRPIPIAGLRFMMAIPVLLVWAFLGRHFQGMGHEWPQKASAPLSLIVLFPDALGMALYYVGLQRTSASLATLAELAYPATAVVLGFGSALRFSLPQWTGLATLLLSLYWIKRETLVVPDSGRLEKRNS